MKIIVPLAVPTLLLCFAGHSTLAAKTRLTPANEMQIISNQLSLDNQLSAILALEGKVEAEEKNRDLQKQLYLQDLTLFDKGARTLQQVENRKLTYEASAATVEELRFRMQALENSADILKMVIKQIGDPSIDNSQAISKKLLENRINDRDALKASLVAAEAILKFDQLQLKRFEQLNTENIKTDNDVLLIKIKVQQSEVKVTALERQIEQLNRRMSPVQK